MKIKFAGTGDGRGIPSIGCKCNRCETARNKGGKDVRRRVCAIITSNSETILLDTPATIRQMLNEEKIFKLTAIFLSHKHWDHIGGITDFGWWANGNIPVYGNKSALNNFEITAELDNICKFYIVHDRETINVGQIKVKAFEVNHVVPTLGFILEENNKRIVHFSDSMDLTLNDYEKKQVKKANVVIFHTPSYSSSTDHINVVNVVEIVKEYPETSFIISHIGHDNLSHAELEEKISPHKNLCVAYDGLEINI